MAVAAYASLVSLTQVLEQIQKHHDWGRIVIDTQQVQNLLDRVDFFIDFLDRHSQEMSDDTGDLARRIKLAVVEAEAIIDHNVVEQLRGVFGKESDKGLSSFQQDLEVILQEMQSIEQVMGMVKLGSAAVQYQKPMNFVPAPSASSMHHASNRRTNQVGIDDRILYIKEKLTTDTKKLQVISIVGMGGIGKTTLAQCVLEDPYIMEQFDKLMWCTISQQYNVHQILQVLLDEDDKTDQHVYVLGERLYKSLCGYKYFIVMDDIWSTEAWNEIRRFFPSQNNGSRIMVTTRLEKVANDISSMSPYHMDILDDDQSWDLLCEKVFGQEDCPDDLKEIGMQIATSCGGLPLSIVAIGGVLSKSNRSPECWESVAQDVTRIAGSEDDDRCMKILSLSYRKLPIHLKACFLYFRCIDGWNKIHLLVAAGLVRSVPRKDIEDVANEYLDELADRNLLTRFYVVGCFKSFKLHDLLHEFRRRELARQILVQTPCIQHISDKDEHQCFMCSREAAFVLSYLEDSLFDTQSSDIVIFVCLNCMIRYPLLYRSRFVKVSDINPVLRAPHPTTLRMVNYAMNNRGCNTLQFISPSPILFLWNLQYLTVDVPSNCGIILPFEIWEMRQLKVLKASHCRLPCPPPSTTTVLDQLQVLNINSLSCTKALVERIRNLLLLRITYDDESLDYSWCGFDELACFHQLEFLCLRARSLPSINFPSTIKVLLLEHCDLSREVLTVVGSLPNLEKLLLDSCNFEEGEWSLDDTEFVRLRSLAIHESNLKCWSVRDNSFPLLASLMLQLEKFLEQIPSSIGDIPALHEICLVECSETVIESARQILNEQRDLGNEDLKIDVTDSKGSRKPLYASI